MTHEEMIRARRADFSMGGDSINFFFKKRVGDTVTVADDLIMREIKSGMLVPSFLTVGLTEAQQLMDDLWACGLRPSEGTGSAGSLKATQDHLETVKDIAYHVLKMNKKT